MNLEQIISSIKQKKSYLCVGLDTDINKIPKHLLKTADPIFEFNKIIIDVTKDLAIAYKPNLAFYESLGAKGIESLRKTIEYIPNNIFKIADAKRGDIGNTSTMYAKSFFETFNFDAVTLSPYMGKDYILNNYLINRIKKQIRYKASPRHVPSKVISISDIPRTKNGKIVELAVKNTIEGNEIKNIQALANPEILKEYKNLKELKN